MWPDAVIIADDTSGPMNADVLPTTEKSAKNRNLRRVPAEETEETKEEGGVCELSRAKGSPRYGRRTFVEGARLR